MKVESSTWQHTSNHLKYCSYHIRYLHLACLSSLESYLQGTCVYQIPSSTPKSIKVVLQNQKGLWNFYKISNSQNYPYSFLFFQKHHNHPIYFPSFHHLRLIILLLPRKVIRTSFLKIQVESYIQKKKSQMFQICPLKRRRRKEVNEDPNLMAYGRFQFLVAFGTFHCLMALERFHKPLKGSIAWWPLKGSNA